MQHSLCVGLGSAAVAAALFFAYKAYANKRYIHVRLIGAIIAVYCGAPAIKFVVKSYGVNIDAAWNDASPARDWLAGIALVGMIICEIMNIKNDALNKRAESHNKYIHEFKNVIIDSLKNDMTDVVIAKNHGIPVDKVQAILMCAALVGEWVSDTGDEDDT